MKAIFTVLLAMAALVSSAQSKQKFDVIVGVHSGVYVTGYGGLPGFALPVNAELLFETYGFRSGLKLEYAVGVYFQEASVSHLGNIMGCVEYAFKVNPKLIIAPALSAGGSGANYVDNEGYGRNVISGIGYVFKGSVNFETGYKQIKFTVAPTYSYSYLKGGSYLGSIAPIHIFGLNLGVRFHLLKPKTESK